MQEMEQNLLIPPNDIRTYASYLVSTVVLQQENTKHGCDISLFR